MMIKNALCAASLAFGAFAASAPVSAALTLPNAGYYTYGNANSYSLPILANYADLASPIINGTGPGNPYYVNSTPGTIKDQVVIYTGASGSDVTTNAAGFDNAYGVPNGKTQPYASIGQNLGVANPGDKAGIVNNTSSTWDANLLNLKGFLDGGQALFLFNNNDTNSDQNLAAWAKLWLTDANNDVYGRYLYFSNTGSAYGSGGVPNGNATTYNPGDVTPSIGNLASTDMVLSGGSLCIGSNGDVIHAGACAGGDPAGSKTINHNLGANQAAYAIDVPLLNSWLKDLFKLGDSDLDDYTLHMDLRLGCQEGSGGWSDCKDIAIDNGFEQLFLVSSNSDFSVPEPSSLVLIALAFIGLGVSSVRSRN
ncbi:MAG: PEP-CTERM sorting domain-containing protein [Ferribacterium limneticum]